MLKSSFCKRGGGSVAEFHSARECHGTHGNPLRGFHGAALHRLKIQLLVSELFSVCVRQYNSEICIIHSAFCLDGAALYLGLIL